MNYFNSHPHEEDDHFLDFSGIFHLISTHILMKRMTGYLSDENYIYDISTHILTRRMTIPTGYIVIANIISTHILTRRMTLI